MKIKAFAVEIHYMYAHSKWRFLLLRKPTPYAYVCAEALHNYYFH